MRPEDGGAPRRAEAPDRIAGSGNTNAQSNDWPALVRQGRFTQARTILRTRGVEAIRAEADRGKRPGPGVGPAGAQAPGPEARAPGSEATAPTPAPASATERAAVETLAEVQELAREKSWARALGRIERLAGTDVPVDPAALEQELRVLRDASASLDRRDPEGALAELEALEDPYLEAEVATQRGTARVLLDDAAAAREDFERALAIDPRHYRAMTNLGNIELEQGDVDAAIAAYEGALRVNDEFANAHHNLGVALRRKGKVAQSVRSLRRAQKAMQQQDAEHAKASAKSLGGGGLKWVRWLLIAGAVVALYLILQQRGIL